MKSVILNAVKDRDGPRSALVKQYFAYIMANDGRTLYVGMTNDLERRAYQHKQKRLPGFTKRYALTRLVHYEATSDVRGAIAREKQLKGWVRAKKVALVETLNPTWDDLAARW